MATRSTPDHPQWHSAPLADLIRFIVTRYHDTLRAELPEIIRSGGAGWSRSTAPILAARVD